MIVSLVVSRTITSPLSMHTTRSSEMGIMLLLLGKLVQLRTHSVRSNDHSSTVSLPLVNRAPSLTVTRQVSNGFLVFFCAMRFPLDTSHGFLVSFSAMRFPLETAQTITTPLEVLTYTILPSKDSATPFTISRFPVASSTSSVFNIFM